MSLPSPDFAERLAQLRRGDPDAIAAFVEEYEPYLRRSLRFRIRNAALQAAADSVDICQSVLGGFLLQLAAGNYDLDSKEDLNRLLAAIANKKFLMLHRRESAAKRSRRITLSMSDLPEASNRDNSIPTQSLEITEIWEKATSIMTSEERTLLHRRKEGQSWEEIAADLNLNALLLRKRLSRALRRVADDLGLDY